MSAIFEGICELLGEAALGAIATPARPAVPGDSKAAAPEHHARAAKRERARRQRKGHRRMPTP